MSCSLGGQTYKTHGEGYAAFIHILITDTLTFVNDFFEKIIFFKFFYIIQANTRVFQHNPNKKITRS